ncbi:MAG: COR domain-containing protein [Chlorobiaceae bacterium]
MNDDFEYLKQIEEELGVELEEVDKLEWYSKGYQVNVDNHITVIGLYGCSIMNLDRIIEPLFGLSHLSTLEVRNNQISDLGPLSSLLSLSTLDVSSNQIRDLGPLSGLSHLSILGVSANQISDLGPLSSLLNLSTLGVAFNQISNLGPLSGLSNLSTLGVSWNQIRDLGPLSGLSNFLTLSVSENQINDLSPLSGLSNFSRLYVRNNQIRDLGPLFGLSNLSTLDVSGNPLKTLPFWITEFAMEIQWSEQGKDGFITFFNSPLESPPQEIVKQGKEAVKNYFRQLDEQDKDYLFEAKLLIVGEPGAGKTTLAQKLEDHNSQLPADDDTTRGIAVKPIFFPVHPEDFPSFDAEKLKGKAFRMNIWDFGGQEIYKSTHRFFLSSSSVYALVIDNRKENEDLDYWLHILEMFGGNSPIIIVQNEKQKLKRDLELAARRQRFDNIKDVCSVDFADENTARLFQLERVIRHQIRELTHIGTPVPARWASVRKALEQEKRQTITRQEYLALCQEQGITKKEDALFLSNYFHDIGVFLHFQEDSLLGGTVFLNPNWATRAVYKLLDHYLLDDQQGRFSRNDAATIWHEDEYDELRDELLRLMQKFFLTYEIDQTGSYIVPEKLPSVQPDYPKDSEHRLQLQYAYNLFMPRGIISQFIVRMHRYIINNNLVWKRGCILERDGAVAEVIEHYAERSITIHISGSNKRDFMTIIAEKLDEINKNYEKMKVDKLIPCNCRECKGLEKPFFYKYADLKRRIDKGKQDIECGNSFEMVNVRQLIDDVFNENSKGGKPMKKIFVSYSHNNVKHLERLQLHLKVLQHEGIVLDVWDDTKIKAGMQWKTEIEKALASAKVGILLVSNEFLASDFIMKYELPSLLQSAVKKGLTVLPLILQPCRYTKSKLSEFQAVNDPSEAFEDLSQSEQDRRFLKLVDRITEVI